MVKKLSIAGGSLSLLAAGYALQFPLLYAFGGLILAFLFSSSCGG